MKPGIFVSIFPYDHITEPVLARAQRNENGWEIRIDEPSTGNHDLEITRLLRDTLSAIRQAPEEFPPAEPAACGNCDGKSDLCQECQIRETYEAVSAIEAMVDAVQQDQESQAKALGEIRTELGNLRVAMELMSQTQRLIADRLGMLPPPEPVRIVYQARGDCQNERGPR